MPRSITAMQARQHHLAWLESRRKVSQQSQSELQIRLWENVGFGNRLLTCLSGVIIGQAASFSRVTIIDAPSDFAPGKLQLAFEVQNQWIDGRRAIRVGCHNNVEEANATRAARCKQGVAGDIGIMDALSHPELTT